MKCYEQTMIQGLKCNMSATGLKGKLVLFGGNGGFHVALQSGCNRMQRRRKIRLEMSELKAAVQSLPVDPRRRPAGGGTRSGQNRSWSPAQTQKENRCSHRFLQKSEKRRISFLSTRVSAWNDPLNSKATDSAAATKEKDSDTETPTRTERLVYFHFNEQHVSKATLLTGRDV